MSPHIYLKVYVGIMILHVSQFPFYEKSKFYILKKGNKTFTVQANKKHKGDGELAFYLFTSLTSSKLEMYLNISYMLVEKLAYPRPVYVSF